MYNPGILEVNAKHVVHTSRKTCRGEPTEKPKPDEGKRKRSFEVDDETPPLKRRKKLKGKEKRKTFENKIFVFNKKKKTWSIGN